MLKGGISMDQVLANHLGQDTMQPSMVLGCEQPNTGYHETNFSMAYSSHISWQQPVLAGADGGVSLAGLRQPVREPRQPPHAEHPRPGEGAGRRAEPRRASARIGPSWTSTSPACARWKSASSACARRRRPRPPRAATRHRRTHAPAGQRPARGHPRAHAAHVRHRRAGLPDRQDPGGVAAAVPRSVRPVLSLPRRARRPPPGVAPRSQRRLRAGVPLLLRSARPTWPDGWQAMPEGEGTVLDTPACCSCRTCGPASSTTTPSCRC